VRAVKQIKATKEKERGEMDIKVRSGVRVKTQDGGNKKRSG